MKHDLHKNHINNFNATETMITINKNNLELGSKYIKVYLD